MMALDRGRKSWTETLPRSEGENKEEEEQLYQYQNLTTHKNWYIEVIL